MADDSNPFPSNPIPKITRDDPAAHSGDVIAENIQALRQLFPSIVTDGKIDFDVLRQLLGDELEDSVERYGLNWKGKARARAFALTPSLGTLRPAKEDSKDWDTTKNIVIEGDNLEVLKILRKSYAGKVKLIYIDPPYNTGKDFVYPDNYTNSLTNYEVLTGQRGEDGARLTSNKESSGRFHTDWLNMIFPRLMLAKDLLREDGLLAVSLNEKEAANFVVLAEAEFGRGAHAANMIWKSKSGGASDTGLIASDHEYVIIFAKSAFSEIYNDREAIATTSYNRSDEKGKYSLERLDKQNLRYSPEADFVLIGPDGSKYHLEHKDPSNPNATWRWSKARIKKEMSSLVFENGKVYTKNYEKSGSKPRTLLVDQRFGRTRTGSSECTDLMKADVFDNPKPSKLIKHLVQIASQDNDLIVDFFAGSGTTGHAVMAQNAADGGRRRYILVQLPQPLDSAKAEQKAAADFCKNLGRPRTIAELTKERLRRAGDQVKSDSPDADVDTGFRVYKLATSNLKPWQPGDDLKADLLEATTNLLPGRTEDDLLVELLLKTGIDLVQPGHRRIIAGLTVHSLGGGTLIVCLGDIPASKARELGDGIADWVKELVPPDGRTTFFFKDSGFDPGGNRAAEARANLAATLRQRLGDKAIEKLGAI